MNKNTPENGEAINREKGGAETRPQYCQEDDQRVGEFISMCAKRRQKSEKPKVIRPIPYRDN